MAITLILGDCNKYLAGCKDKQFSLGIVDPPYGLDIANMNMGLGKSDKCSKSKNRKWSKNNFDKSTPEDSYFISLFQYSQNQIIWGGNYFKLFPCSHYIIWDKEIPEGLTFADCEFAWTSFNKAPRIFRYSAYLNKQTKFHPTQKPVQLYKWLLKNYAKHGDTILDTHGGSMSSVIACIDGGFDMTCIELDPDYFEAGVKRVQNHVRQLDMFIERPEIKIIEL